ncbi:cytochrome c biogenesis protein ResB [Opitutales bacterium]|nr:cytochrome c biogenesis protein ResB [Opitutales bacterium]
MPEKPKKSISSLSERRKRFVWLIPFANLRITLTLLSFSMILIFVATLEQVRIGIRGAQAEFFESMYGIWHYPEQFWGGDILNFLPIPIPGGYLLGGLLILNLLAAFITRFQWTGKKMGIQFIHLGIIMLLVGQLATQAMQEESRMQINKGESKNYLERFHGVELAFIDVTDAQTERVVALPEALLERGGLHYAEGLPFKVRVLDFGPNCEFNSLPPANKVKGPTAGVNRGVIQSANLEIRPKPEDFSSEGMNFGYVVFELLDGAESMGTWAAISHPAGNHWWAQINPKMGDLAFQPIRTNGRLWGVTLRPEREYLPYSIELIGIANEFYQGTDIPFNFESEIVLDMEKNQSRRALVYMNTPLRHEGKTFYQYQMNKSADYTVFQVVRNPSWLVPYIACILVSIGLLWQFSFHLARFLNKNSGANRAAV